MPEDSASKTVSERIEDANRRGADILTKAQPTWVDVMPARDFIPGFKENLVLFAGPPLDPAECLEAGPHCHRRSGSAGGSGKDRRGGVGDGAAR